MDAAELRPGDLVSVTHEYPYRGFLLYENERLCIFLERRHERLAFFCCDAPVRFTLEAAACLTVRPISRIDQSASDDYELI
jgi:hypothetical protein